MLPRKLRVRGGGLLVQIVVFQMLERTYNVVHWMATMQNDKSAMRRSGIAINLLSYFSAAWCGIVIIVLGCFWIGSSGFQIWKNLAEPGSDVADFAGRLTGAGLLGLLIVLVLGVSLGRFLLRALPPRLSERTRGGRFGTIGAVALCAVFVGLLVVWASMLAITQSDSTDSILSDPALASVGFSIVLAMFYMSCAIYPVILRHWKPRAFLERPFVLFLRRFSTFSDRAVISLVLREAASGVPVVFLTPEISRPGDWDPFVVGFAGLKLLHPWQSMPIVLRASDRDWQGAADELIRRSQTILLDTSETSSAMRTEAEMIDNAGRWSDTVSLRLFARNAAPGKDLVGGSTGARLIEYRKSWVRAFPRMTIGLVTVLIVCVFLGGPLLLIGPIFMRSSALILTIAVAAYAYYSAFVRPTINRKAKSALRAVLRTGS